MSNPLSQCKVYTMNGIDMIHISEFARITNRSVRSTRHLIEDGNSIRKMKFFRDRSRLMIPVAEIFGYPLTDKGYATGLRNIYHYVLENDQFVKVLCKRCTFEDEPCECRKVAENLVVPEGDK